MSETVTRDLLLGLDDLEIKPITVPDHIKAWGGLILHIKTLTRAQQDTYLKRQFGSTVLRQNAKKGDGAQDISGVQIYGHDTLLVIAGLCTPSGLPLFVPEDAAKLEAKNGEAIGWIAKEITKHSGMEEDAKVASGEKTPEDKTQEDLKA